MAINKAIAQKRFKQLRLLLELETDVNSRDKGLRTPLMEICFMESEKRAVAIAKELLRRGGDLSLKDKAGLTPLSHAILQNKEKLVATFLEEAGNHNLNMKDSNGNTPLFHAATTGSFDILKMLVETLRKYRLSVDIPNNDGFTPLMQASKMGHIFSSRYLISEGKACKFLRDNREYKTADEWQETEGNKRIAENPMLFQLLPFQTKQESFNEKLNESNKPRPMTAPGRLVMTSSYKDDFRKVFSVYERQLSSSYRPGCRPIIPKEPELPSTPSETSECSDITDFDSLLSFSLPDVRTFRRRGSTFKGLLPPGEGGGDKVAFRRRSVAAGNLAELKGSRKLSLSFPNGSLTTRNFTNNLSVSSSDSPRSKSPTSNGNRRMSMQTASTSIRAVTSSYTPRRGSLSVPKLRKPDQVKILARPSPSLKVKLHTLAEASDSEQENDEEK